MENKLCDALAEESARLIASSTSNSTNPPLFLPFSASSIWDPLISNANANPNPHPDSNPNPNPTSLFDVSVEHGDPPLIRPPFTTAPSPHLSATALLQRASMMGPTTTRHVEGMADPVSTWQGGKKLTRDFLGVSAGEEEESQQSRQLFDISRSFFKIEAESQIDGGPITCPGQDNPLRRQK